MRTKIFIASAIIFLVCGIIVVQLFSQTPQAVFRRFVVSPVPDSVHAIEEKHLLAMDNNLWVVRFEIGGADLQTILSTEGFKPIDEGKMFKRWDKLTGGEIQIEKEDYLAEWKQRIQYAVNLDVRFSKSWQIFMLEERHGRKYFFFDTNSSSAVFVAEAP